MQINHFNRKNDHQIIISSHLAKDLLINKNDLIELLFFNSHLQRFSFTIKDTFESNGLLDANIAYIPFIFFKNFFNENNHINAIELHMFHPFDADQILKKVVKKIGVPLITYSWIDSYHYIYNDIKKMKAIIYFILLLLVIISSFSITSLSIMTISKKTQEIAILRTIGANNCLIQIIFLYYGLRSVMIGTFLGLITGIIIVLNFKGIVFFLDKSFKDNILLDNIYYHHFLLLKINISDVITILISTIIIGIIANWYPAYYASKINPSKILKEY
ncbi:FtsX-like permease family protein [Buchnera aphidicola]|uniref:FtsX-like permease family protein n=1 Tax=Buchnera aphidicola TaxID=9 RepID=UPI0034638BF2